MYWAEKERVVQTADCGFSLETMCFFFIFPARILSRRLTLTDSQNKQFAEATAVASEQEQRQSSQVRQNYDCHQRCNAALTIKCTCICCVQTPAFTVEFFENVKPKVENFKQNFVRMVVLKLNGLHCVILYKIVMLWYSL